MTSSMRIWKVNDSGSNLTREYHLAGVALNYFLPPGLSAVSRAIHTALFPLKWLAWRATAALLNFQFGCAISFVTVHIVYVYLSSGYPGTRAPLCYL